MQKTPTKAKRENAPLGSLTASSGENKVETCPMQWNECRQGNKCLLGTWNFAHINLILLEHFFYISRKLVPGILAKNSIIINFIKRIRLFIFL